MNWGITSSRMCFVRFKELADRKKEIYDDDLIALMRTATDPEKRPHCAG